MEWRVFLDEGVAWLHQSGIRILLIIILLWVAMRVARVVVRRLFSVLSLSKPDEAWRKRIATLQSLTRYVVNFGLLGLGLVTLLDQMGISIGPILAGAGIIGVAVGFGSQQLVQDIISGLFILIDDQIRVGDVVNVAGVGGLVEEVTLRTTVLRDLAGNVHYVRNGHIDMIVIAVSHHKSLRGSFALVVTGPQTDGVHMAPVAFRLGVKFWISINFRGGGKKKPRLLCLGQSQGLVRTERTNF